MAKNVATEGHECNGHGGEISSCKTAVLVAEEALLQRFAMFRHHSSERETAVSLSGGADAAIDSCRWLCRVEYANVSASRLIGSGWHLHYTLLRRSEGTLEGGHGVAAGLSIE